MPISLFADGVIPYFNGRSPYPGEVDEFAWDRSTLLRGLRAGRLDAELANGSWRIWQEADGTYSGELYEWRRRSAPPVPQTFSDLSETEAAQIAYTWAYFTAGY